MKLKLKDIHGDYLRLFDYFQNNSFDMVIEKAGLDSIATKNSDDVPLLLKEVYEQIYYVLKPGGIFISISNKNFGKKYNEIIKILILFISFKTNNLTIYKN